MRNHSYENDFDLHENETACRTHFHKKGFALTLVLKQRHKRTRKWPICSVEEWAPALRVKTISSQAHKTGSCCMVPRRSFLKICDEQPRPFYKGAPPPPPAQNIRRHFNDRRGKSQKKLLIAGQKILQFILI